MGRQLSYPSRDLVGIKRHATTPKASDAFFGIKPVKASDLCGVGIDSIYVEEGSVYDDGQVIGTLEEYGLRSQAARMRRPATQPGGWSLVYLR